MLSLLAVLGAVAAGLRFNDQLVGLTGDNATYILLARDLVTGSTYENAGYPWGYPALLAPILAVAGPDNMVAAIPWMKLLTLLLFVAALPLVYALFRTRLAVFSVFAVTVLLAVNNVALFHANDIMSEVPYILVTYGALLYWQKAVAPGTKSDTGTGLRRRELLQAGLLIAAAYYVRTIGVALIGASLLVLLCYRKLRAAMALAAAVGLLALPWLVASRNSDLNSYADQLLLRDPYNPSLGHISSLAELLGRLLGTARLYLFSVFPNMLLPAPAPGALLALISPILGVLVLVGLLVCLIRKQEILELYTVLFLGVICVWPWTGDRFLLPVYPLLLYYTVEGAAWLGGLARRVLRRPDGVNFGSRLWPVAAIIALLVALPNIWLAGGAAAENVAYLSGRALPSGHTPDWQSYFAACEWLKLNTPPGSVVMSRKSTITTVYSSRPSVQIPLTAPENYPPYFKQYNVSYIVEDAFAWSVHTINYLRPALRARPEQYKLLYTSGKPVVRIWQVVGR